MNGDTCRGLHATLRWVSWKGYAGDSQVMGWVREDGAGYVLPTEDGRWWVTWAHPMQCGGPGWHHHAFGSYVDPTAGAMAFDKVYDLERIAGNKDRCPDAITENAA